MYQENLIYDPMRSRFQKKYQFMTWEDGFFFQISTWMNEKKDLKMKIVIFYRFCRQAQLRMPTSMFLPLRGNF